MKHWATMTLRILLPDRVFAEVKEVRRIVVETPAGSFGMLPHRLDCAAVLAPGILSHETAGGGEVFTAVDEGIVVKAGPDVVISVRSAIGGVPLGELRQAVRRQFMNLDDQERRMRSALVKLESGMMRRFMEFQHG